MASMDLASGRRRGSSQQLSPCGGADRISALPDDLLLLILARIGCARTAARTSVLSRQWCGSLWARLREVVFRDVAFPPLEAALGHVSPAVSLLQIRVPDERRPDAAGFSSLLRAAARLDPEELVMAFPSGYGNPYHQGELPRFERATSISLTARDLHLSAPADRECIFPALTTLVLSGCTVHGLSTLLPRCLCLRVLKYAVRHGSARSSCIYTITVHSESLRELVVVESSEPVRRVDIAAPMLEQLTVSYYASRDLSVAVLAPMAERVLWQCQYRYPGTNLFTAFGNWELEMVAFMMSSSMVPVGQTRPPPLLRIDAHIGRDFFNLSDLLENFPADHLEQQIEKHLQMQAAADLSVMELQLHVKPLGHVYGALVLYLLGMRRVRTAVCNLKVVLYVHELRCREDADIQHDHSYCEPTDCYCKPTDWRNQTISLTQFEEVEIHGFRGEDHELDVLEMVFRCAPMLRKMIVKQSNEFAPSDPKIRDVFRAHPSVECYLD